MANIFLSYAHQDIQRVEPLVSLLEAKGCSVWWDRDLEPGSDFEREIERALTAATHVIIALTNNVAKSDWVRAEAGVGLEGAKLIPVLLDDVPIPLSLRALHVADLRAWPKNGANQVQKLIDTVAPRPQRLERPFIGREDTMHRLQQTFEDASRGGGGIVMLAGEPGIGKTRCAEEFARQVEDQGTLVLWGRCYEHPGAPAYWPWVQIIQELARASSDDELRVLFGAGGREVAALVPELGERLGVEPAQLLDHDNPGEQRFRFFDAISRIFFQVAAGLPLVLILDDIHWADASSLSLLEFIATDLHRNAMLVLCSYRDVEVTRKSQLLATLGELTRVHGVQRLRLAGLGETDTAALTSAIAGIDLPAAVARTIFEQTDGNPLFVNEIARVVADESRTSRGNVLAVEVPDGIREAIGRRLDRLTPRCNELLAIAAVVGREFDLRVLARAQQAELEDCARELHPAAEANLVQPVESSPTVFRFSHALMRETLYEELSTFDRLKSHQRVAEALINVYGSRIDPVLSQIAHHYFESSALGDFESAVKFALRAADRDERMYAFEEAARRCEQAIEVLTANSREEDPRMLPTYLRYARLKQTEPANWSQSLEIYARGLELARRLGEAQMFAQFVTRILYAASQSPQVRAIPLVKEALQLLSPDDECNRARLLAHLAYALRVEGDRAQATCTATEAVERARATTDESALVEALKLTVMTLRGDASTLAQRLDYGRELIEISASLEKDPFELGDAYLWHILNTLEVGNMEDLTALLDSYSRHAERHGFRHHMYEARLFDIMVKLLHAEWSAAEEAAEAELKVGQKFEQQAGWYSAFGSEGLYGAQMFVINRETGRLRAMAPLVRNMIESGRSRLWLPGLMLTCCEVGMLDKAKEAFEQLAAFDFSAIADDELWPVSMVYCAETCAVIEDTARAKVLYEVLLPYREQVANHPLAACLGPFAMYLGMLAKVLERSEVAEEHFRTAIEMDRKMGAWPLLARAEWHLGCLLLSSESEANAEAGRQVLLDAEQLANRFGMKGLEADIAELLNEGARELPDGLTPREVDVLQLLAIGRSNKDISTALAISLSTVATHIRSILNKTGCANRTEAAAYAIRLELT